jgi:hypothetical protein
MRVLLDVVSYVLGVVPDVVRALRRRGAKRAAIVWDEQHHWSDYDERGLPVQRHCIYCKQLRVTAAKHCRGSVV